VIKYNRISKFSGMKEKILIFQNLKKKYSRHYSREVLIKFRYF